VCTTTPFLANAGRKAAGYLSVLKYDSIIQLKGLGHRHMIPHVIVICSHCRYFKEMILIQPGFRLVLDEFECTNVCFWFIPPSLRGQEENEEWWNKIHTVSNIKTK
jgi:hypothetical protein